MMEPAIVFAAVNKALAATMSFVPRNLALIFVVMVLAETLVVMGVMERLSFIGQPLVCWCRLPPESVLCLVTACGSVLAANAMVGGFYRDGRFTSKEAFLAALLNGVPEYLRNFFLWSVPVAVPLLGVRVGLVYVLVFWSTAFVQLAVTVLLSRFLLEPGEKAGLVDSDPLAATGRLSLVNAIKKAVRQRGHLILRLGGTLTLVTFLVCLAMELGLFAPLEGWFAAFGQIVGLPPAATAPLVAYAAQPLAGMAAAGSLLHEGVLDVHQGVVAVLLGGIIMLPMLTLRWRLPNYTAIFGLKLGFLLTLAGLLVAVVVRAGFLAIVI
jgi:hypothetical protein